MNYKSLIIAILIAAILLLTGCKKTDTSDLISFDVENTKAITVNLDDIFEIERIVILEEIDIISDSLDKSTLLIGEAKWSDSVEVKSVYNELLLKTQKLPYITGKKILPVLFLKRHYANVPEDIQIITPEDIIKK
ncbi:MAG: hypothetical protein ACQERS_12710 [Bacteroidota bacterium]